MIRINAHFFFKAGEKMGHLRTSATESGALFAIAFNARSALSELLGNDNPLALRISNHTGERLNKSLDSLMELIATDLASKKPEQLSSALVGSQELFTKFDHELAAELGSRDTYALSQRGVYDTAELVRQASNVFGRSVRLALPDETLKDFDEAGRCLAFEVPTACGFHLMRGVEAVLRRWYDLTPITKKDPEPRFQQCLDQLMKHFPKDKKGNIKDRSVRTSIAALDQIRELYRNAVAHPDFFLEDADEAEQWFRIAVTAVEQMAPHIAKAKGGP